MQKAKHETLIRYLLYVPFLVFIYILQAMICSNLPIAGAKPLILPVAAICIAMFEGSVRGGVLGLLSGMLCDFSFNNAPIAFTLTLTAICLIVGILADLVLARGFPTFIVCCVTGLLLCAYIQMHGILSVDGTQLPALVKMAFLQLFYSLLFTLPIYFVTRTISRTPKTI